VDPVIKNTTLSDLTGRLFVEIDRCATDAIQALTGVSLGKRTLKHGEGINYRREAVMSARVLCRPCAGEGYYRTS
jgi:formylmethanofuran dehydrogenase subunit E